MIGEEKIQRVHPVAGYEPAMARLVWALEDTRRRTLASLEGLAEQALDWTDEQARNSIGTLLYHVAAIEADWVYSDILGLPFPDELMRHFPIDVREEGGRLSPVSGLLSAHLQRLSAVRALTLAALRELRDADLDRPRAMQGYSVTPAWALHHLMQHEAEHRGQIGALRGRSG